MRLDEFGPAPKQPQPEQRKPDGVEFSASVNCQVCDEFVPEQTYYPTESLLIWTCSKDHRSYIEGFRAF